LSFAEPILNADERVEQAFRPAIPGSEKVGFSH
jgi:hypothetical protein